MCGFCGFTYYHGSMAVAVGIIENAEKIVFTIRAQEPQKGKIALPGGFVDYEESLENGLIRELREELNLTVKTPKYLCSHWEKYSYQDVIYFSTIAYFVVSIEDISKAKASDDIDAFFLASLGEIERRELAFESDRRALDIYGKRILSNLKNQS
jgi:ADP-ribose pyrophosphatase YjhB (NUDIX family)